MDFAIREPAGKPVAAAAVAAIHELDPNLPVQQVGTMERILASRSRGSGSG